MDASSPNTTPATSPVALNFGRVLFGFLLLGFTDLLASYTVPGPELGGSRETLAMVTLLMGRAALAGLACSALLTCVAFIATKAYPKRGVYLLAATLGIATFFFLNVETFDGASIQSNERLPAIKIAFYTVGIAAILFAVWLGRVVMNRHTEERAVSRSIAIAGVILAQIILWQNVAQFSGLYWMLHTQLTVIATVVLIFGPGVWWVSSNMHTKVVLALSIVFVLGALLVRITSIHARVESASLSRATASGEFRPLTSRLFNLVSSSYRTSPGRIAATDIPRDSAEQHKAAREWFQSQLGAVENLNVLLIAVDTLRADHCGFLGYEENPTTPHLDQLAKESFIFTRAYSTYPTSNVSYSSILTGLLPRATPAYARIKGFDWTFDPLVPTPSLFAARGRKTIGISAFNAQTAQDDNWFGLLRRGFEIYNPDQETVQLPADEITDSVIGQLEKLDQKPFFLWAHYLDPHEPYKRHPGVDFGESKTQRYDADIHWTDQNVGRLITHLKKTGLYDKTIIVLVSDHGEEFHEHGGWRHNSSVYDEQIHVPFLIRIPKVSGRSIDKVVSLVDLHPTLASLLNLNDPLKRHGQSLLPVMFDEDNERRGFAYAEHFYLVSRKDFDNKKTLISGDKKLIEFPQRESFEMYDLKDDPLERRNQIGRDDQTFVSLAGLMAAIDRDLDSYHQEDGEAALEPREAFRGLIEKAADDLLAGEAEESAEAYITLRSQLFLALGELSPNALKHFSESERRDLAIRMANETPKIKSPGQRSNAVKVLCLLRVPETYKQIESYFTDPSYAVRFSAALGLANSGVKSAQPYLQVALRSKLADPSKIAAALARLGDPEAGPWVIPTLVAPSKAIVGAMLQHLPYIQVPNMGFFIRDFLTEGRWHTRMAQGALAKSLATMTSDAELKWLLFYLTGNSGTVVRQFAEESLRKSGVSAEDIAAAREAVDLEVDAAVEVKNRAFEQAFRNFRLAIEKGPYFNPGLRFRLARYLHLAGKTAEAKDVLEVIVAGAENPLEKKLARRRIEMLAWPARIEAEANFGLTISAANIPSRMTPSVPAQFTIKVKNTGKNAIQGGFWQHAANLTIGWLNDKGEVLAQDVTWDNFLPHEGLLPGEELILPVVAMTPDALNVDARAFIQFHQPWLKLNDPKVYIHATKTKIGSTAK